MSKEKFAMLIALLERATFDVDDEVKESINRAHEMISHHCLSADTFSDLISLEDWVLKAHELLEANEK